MILKTTLDFVENEVSSRIDQIEAKDETLARKLFAQAGELGLLSTDIPEEYGGLGLDKAATCVVTEAMGTAASFAVSHGAHTGIGTLPIVYYGNEDQKSKYLPGLADGSKIGAYCLTEPSAGSDAVGGCRTKAVLERGRQALHPQRREDLHHQRRLGRLRSSYSPRSTAATSPPSSWSGTLRACLRAPRKRSWASRAPPPPRSSWKTLRCRWRTCSTSRGKGHHIALNVLNIGRYKLGAATRRRMQGAL